MTTVDFWFDPICPWTWLTSRWLVEVEGVRDVRTRWRLMSLSILNEGTLDQGADLLRVLAAAGDQYDNEAVARLYTALGTRLHVRGGDVDLSAALADAQLPTELAAFADSDFYDAAIRNSHQESQDAFGDEVGTPVLGVGDAVYNGPVVSPAPKGEDAGRLWDAVVGVPGVYEIKRLRTTAPDFS
ncbi:DsbA family protein [Nocardia sp. NPDC004068]|uniref:DsbA family protein n=1 Tax=Nocardia sp. NPDC004068 TaxID=3364303 RepID=UPI0036A38E44